MLFVWNCGKRQSNLDMFSTLFGSSSVGAFYFLHLASAAAATALRFLNVPSFSRLRNNFRWVLIQQIALPLVEFDPFCGEIWVIMNTCPQDIVAMALCGSG